MTYGIFHLRVLAHCRPWVPETMDRGTMHEEGTHQKSTVHWAATEYWACRDTSGELAGFLEFVGKRTCCQAGRSCYYTETNAVTEVMGAQGEGPSGRDKIRCFRDRFVLGAWHYSLLNHVTWGKLLNLPELGLSYLSNRSNSVYNMSLMS